ncbi:hypothetical protein V6N13_004548 [Hibiscus sabdariffa]
MAMGWWVLVGMASQDFGKVSLHAGQNWLVKPTSLRPLSTSDTSGSTTPRICQFCMVVTLAQPSFPYFLITLARYRV